MNTLAARALLPEQTTKDGAFMEPRGCNRWQPVANPPASRTAETRENSCRSLRPVAVSAGCSGVEHILELPDFDARLNTSDSAVLARTERSGGELAMRSQWSAKRLAPAGCIPNARLIS